MKKPLSKDLSNKQENLKIYRTRRHSLKDLYIVIFLTILSLAILIIPINKYIANSIIHPLNIALGLLIVFLSGFSFWAALIPITKIGSSKRLLLTLLFGIVLLILSYDFMKLNPFNGFKMFFLIILSVFIILMCIITFLRRSRTPKIIKKQNSKDITGLNDQWKTSSFSSILAEHEKESENLKKNKTNFRSLDLILISLITIIAIVYILVPNFNAKIITTILGVLLLLFPGYSFFAAVYPKEDDLNGIERASLTFGFPLIGFAFTFLIINIKPIAVSIPFILLLLATFTLVFIIIAYIRRRRISENGDDLLNVIKPPNSNNPSSKKELTHEKTSSKIITDEPEQEKISKHKFVSTDLLLIFLTTLLAVIFIVIPKLNDTFIRTVLGLFLILFIPGYSLIAALFPKKDDLDGIERAALSFGLSIAVTPLIGLALNYTPYGIRLTPILISLSAFTMIMIVIAYFRRRRVTEGEKYYVNFGGFINSFKGIFKGESKTSKLLSIILIISILLAIGTTAYVIIKPKQGETFTEFYILGPGGQASGYPTNLTVGQNASVIIGIVNHEQKTVDYNLVVTSNGAVMSNMNITVANGNKTEIPYTFSTSTSGNKTIGFLLYKLPDNVNIYRSLHLNVNVV
jgi:uncharacterized membrane protein